MKPSDEEQVLMDKYSITCETKYIFKYKNYQYDDLQQALNFATFDQQKLSSKNTQ